MRNKIYFMLLSLMILINGTATQALEVNKNLDQIFNSEEWDEFYITIDIFNTNVFKLFDETKQYDTDLKKKFFMKTEGYKNYKKKLNELSLVVKNHMFMKKLDSSLSDYDIKKGGFYLNFHESFYVGYTCSNYNKIIKKFVYFDMLPKKDGTLFLPCPEDKALNIENIENKTIKIKFNITGIVKKEMTCRLMRDPSIIETKIEELLNSTNATFYIIDNSTGDVLYSKNYVSKK